jgi:hypothetical protein
MPTAPTRRRTATGTIEDAPNASSPPSARRAKYASGPLIDALPHVKRTTTAREAAIPSVQRRRASASNAPATRTARRGPSSRIAISASAPASSACRTPTAPAVTARPSRTCAWSARATLTATASSVTVSFADDEPHTEPQRRGRSVTVQGDGPGHREPSGATRGT